MLHNSDNETTKQMIPYDQFIQSKKPLAQLHGFTPTTPPHKSLFGHQRDIALWLVRGGRRACFKAFGLGKTRTHLQVAKWTCEHVPDKKYLIVCPLGVRYVFMQEEGPAMGIEMTFCQTDAEVAVAKTQIIITNYESVREEKITITPDTFAGAGLDESSILRSYGSKTFQLFNDIFQTIPYRFVFTATPSPNRHKELIHYAAFLGIMDSGQALTRFFKRDSQKAGNLTLLESTEDEFWDWLASWACFLQAPSDLGYSDKGYVMPGLKVHWVCVPVDHKQAWKMVDSWGQSQLFLDKSTGLKELAETKRDTIVTRIAKAKEIIEEHSKKNFIIWHDLEDERRVLEKAIPNIRTVYGTQDLEKREEIIMEFSKRGGFNLGTKPILSGSGCNLQKHCHDAIFLGSSYKFNDFIQACYRILRFGQNHVVNIYIIYSESEDAVIASLKQKWQQHNELVAKMSNLLKLYKLDLESMQILRKTGCKRLELAGETFRAINNDSVLELMPTGDGSGNWPDNSVDLMVTSVPFGTQYEYSQSYQDMGVNEDNAKFFEQMEYLVPNLLRVLKPGRLACIHVKDRIRFGGQYGTGVPTVDRFSDKTADQFERHGFDFLGRITIDTDVVRENAQTYRLGWTENSKDSTKMGVGMSEYVLILRKPQSDRSKAYADVPVTKDKAIYMRADWQVDASGLWKSNGNRLPDPDILQNMPLGAVRRMWEEHCHKHGYDWREHVEVAQALEDKGYLPATWMLFAPISNNPAIWTDIIRMKILSRKNSSEAQQKKFKNHVCPLQIDVCERLIGRYSNKGEIVMDPFAGIFTVPYCAQKLGRIGWGLELSPEYWQMGCGFCEQSERERTMPTLFDILDIGAVDNGVKLVEQ